MGTSAASGWARFYQERLAELWSGRMDEKKGRHAEAAQVTVVGMVWKPLKAWRTRKYSRNLGKVQPLKVCLLSPAPSSFLTVPQLPNTTCGGHPAS